MDTFYFIFLESLRSILPLIMTAMFILGFFFTRPGKSLIRSFIDNFLDKGIKDPKPQSNSLELDKETYDNIAKIVSEKLRDLTDNNEENIKIAKQKLNAALEDEINDFLKNNDDNSKIKEIIAERIELETSIIADDVLNNAENFEEINNKYNLRSKQKSTISLNAHIEQEYISARRTKQLMSNLFMAVNIMYFSGLFFFLISSFSISSERMSDNFIPTKLALGVSFAYLGFGSFIIYMIKFCNARTLTLLSLKEEMSKRQDVVEIAKKLMHTEINENHVTIIKLLTTNYSVREQSTKHPYELLFNGIKDSNIIFKAGKFELTKEKEKENTPK